MWRHTLTGAAIVALSATTASAQVASGIWCTPFYCWVVGGAEYSPQFEFSGGITLRFPK